MKNIILLAAVSMSSLYTFSQKPERMIEKQSSNLKDPSDAALNLYNKGVNFSYNKEYGLANKNYEMALALDSDYIDAYNNLGLFISMSSIMTDQE